MILALAQPSSTGIINDVLSGLILLGVGLAVKHLGQLVAEQHKLSENFREHTESDTRNFRELRKLAKSANRNARSAARRAQGAVDRVDERARVLESSTR